MWHNCMFSVVPVVHVHAHKTILSSHSSYAQIMLLNSGRRGMEGSWEGERLGGDKRYGGRLRRCGGEKW